MTKKTKPPTSAPASRVPQVMLVPLMLGVALLWAGVSTLPMIDDVLNRRDRFILDQYHRSGEKAPVRDDVVILGIDDASRSLDTLWPEDLAASPALSAMKRSYPYPRRVWGQLLDRLFSAGAKVVFLDVTFTSPSTDPEDDHLLKEALEKYQSRVVIGGKFEQQSAGENIRIELKVPNISVFDAKKQPYGLLNFWPDFDEVVRAIEFRLNHSQAMLLSGDTLRVMNPGEESYDHVVRMIASLSHPDSVVELPDEARIRFGPLNSYEPVSLMNVFVDDFWKNNFAEGAYFKDRIVMVGAVATDLQDFQATPLGRVAGVQLHAHALGALLSRSFLHSAPEWWRLAALASGLFVAWLVVTCVRQPLLCLLTLVGLSVAAIYGGSWLFDHRDLEISPLSFGLPLLLCGSVGLAGDFLVQLREKRKLQRFLARYTSPEIMQEMLRDRAGLYTTLSGVGRNVTVLFSDVRGFTSMSENMTPQQVVTQLNEYLSRMVEHVFRQRGIVDKFIGDAVMAVWGSTRSVQDDAGAKDDAIKAVSSALAMRSALDELNVGWTARGMSPLHFGIGIHQGPVVVGNIGSESPFEKMDFTVIGDSVNLASRLESATKEYGVDLIISSAVYQHVQDDFVCRSADLVVVKGKSKPVEVFAVTGTRQGGVHVGISDYEDGVRLYRQGDFAAALRAFEHAVIAGLNDRLTQMHQQRCQDLLAAPPEKWDGVFVMTKK